MSLAVAGKLLVQLPQGYALPTVPDRTRDPGPDPECSSI